MQSDVVYGPEVIESLVVHIFESLPRRREAKYPDKQYLVCLPRDIFQFLRNNMPVRLNAPYIQRMARQYVDIPIRQHRKIYG